MAASAPQALLKPAPVGRIALFLPSLGGGGAERAAVNLAAGLVAEGAEVDMVLARAGGVYRQALPDRVRVVDLGAGRVLAAVRPLIRYLRDVCPRVMLSSQNHANVAALWARRLAGVGTRLVISEHTNLSRSAKEAVRVGDRLMPFFVKRFYPWSDAIVAVSQGVADGLSALTGLGPERIRVIYNPVVSPRLAEAALEVPDHPWLTDGTVPVIVAAGRLAREKDFATLIEAFARVRARREAKLIILGEGEERAALEGLVVRRGLAGQVDMPGFVSNPPAYMARAAVFALSSRWEGLANVVIEALACGVPVVSTDCPSGPAEILERGEYGELVPVGDPAALARGILGALDAPRAPDRLRERARRFAVDRITREYLRVLAGD